METCAINILGNTESYPLFICIETYVHHFSKDFDKTLDFCLTQNSALKTAETSENSLENSEKTSEMLQKLKGKYLKFLGDRVKIKENVLTKGEFVAKNSENLLKNQRKTLSYDPDLKGKIYGCMNSEEGNRYQHEMAQRTGEHKYVPWIMVDGVHDEGKEAKILESLVEFICGEDYKKCGLEE